MRVTREQWPVGQGCFATGEIRTHNSNSLNYIFDCGARRVSTLEPLITVYSSRIPYVDALFISHFDGDHVDGLDTLLARVRVRTVYLPYLDMPSKIIELIEAQAEGRFSGSLVQAHLDPCRWFGDRGVERVVLIRNSSESPDEVDDFPGPSGEPDEGETIRFKESQQARSSSQPTEGGSATLLELDLGASVLVSGGSGLLDWVLVPYVPKADQARLTKFEQNVRAALNIPHGQLIGSKEIADALRNETGRKALRSCYDAIIAHGGGRNHNRISMSLYSGPTGRHPNHKWILEHSNPWRGWGGPGTKVGWLGTGDAKLKQAGVRSALLQFYSRVAPEIASLLLPHHGSHRNFHDDLLGLSALRTCIAAADDSDTGYRHPSPSVVASVASAGKNLVHVTKASHSRLAEFIHG